MLCYGSDFPDVSDFQENPLFLCLFQRGVGVPGSMASRTIENERDRRITIMTTTFMPSSAKLSVIAFNCGAFFLITLDSSKCLFHGNDCYYFIRYCPLRNLFQFLGGYTSPFIMELPAIIYQRLMLFALCFW